MSKKAYEVISPGTWSCGRSAAMSKKAYEVISPLQRDGRRYEIGATIQLTDDEAAPLLAHTIREVAVEQNAADFLGRGKKK